MEERHQKAVKGRERELNQNKTVTRHPGELRTPDEYRRIQEFMHKDEGSRMKIVERIVELESQVDRFGNLQPMMIKVSRRQPVTERYREFTMAKSRVILQLVFIAISQSGWFTFWIFNDYIPTQKGEKKEYFKPVDPAKYRLTLKVLGTTGVAGVVLGWCSIALNISARIRGYQDFYEARKDRKRWGFDDLQPSFGEATNMLVVYICFWMDNFFQIAAILAQSTEGLFLLFELPWLLGSIIPLILDLFSIAWYARAIWRMGPRMGAWSWWACCAFTRDRSREVEEVKISGHHLEEAGMSANDVAATYRGPLVRFKHEVGERDRENDNTIGYQPNLLKRTHSDGLKEYESWSQEDQVALFRKCKKQLKKYKKKLDEAGIEIPTYNHPNPGPKAMYKTVQVAYQLTLDLQKERKHEWKLRKTATKPFEAVINYAKKGVTALNDGYDGRHGGRRLGLDEIPLTNFPEEIAGTREAREDHHRGPSNFSNNSHSYDPYEPDTDLEAGPGPTISHQPRLTTRRSTTFGPNNSEPGLPLHSPYPGDQSLVSTGAAVFNGVPHHEVPMDVEQGQFVGANPTGHRRGYQHGPPPSDNQQSPYDSDGVSRRRSLSKANHRASKALRSRRQSLQYSSLDDSE
ncbi:hypothetical protein T439DRAFT_76426 [Meredithblackwellia eburnea MCA 4105]